MITMVKNQAKDYLAKRSYEINVAEIWKSNDMELPGMLWMDDIFKLLTEDEQEIFLWHHMGSSVMESCSSNEHYIRGGKSKKIEDYSKVEGFLWRKVKMIPPFFIFYNKFLFLNRLIYRNN